MLESGKNKFLVKIAGRKLLWFFVALLVAILYGAIGSGNTHVASAAVHSQYPVPKIYVGLNPSRSSHLRMCEPDCRPTCGPDCGPTSTPESEVPAATPTVQPTPTVNEPVVPPTKGFPSLPPTGSDPGKHRLS